MNLAAVRRKQFPTTSVERQSSRPRMYRGCGFGAKPCSPSCSATRGARPLISAFPQPRSSRLASRSKSSRSENFGAPPTASPLSSGRWQSAPTRPRTSCVRRVEGAPSPDQAQTDPCKARAEGRLGKPLMLPDWPPPRRTFTSVTRCDAAFRGLRPSARRHGPVHDEGRPVRRSRRPLREEAL